MGYWFIAVRKANVVIFLQVSCFFVNGWQRRQSALQLFMKLKTRSQLVEWGNMLDEAVKREFFCLGIQLDDRALA